MPFTLELTFGGLCMLVEEPAGIARGMYVLMPNMKMEGMVHVPLLVYEGAYTGEDGRQAMAIEREVISLRSLAPHSKRKPLPDYIARASAYAGRAVEPRWLTNHTPDGPLAARIELPGGLEVRRRGDLADLNVGLQSGEKLEHLAGQVTTSFQVEDEQAPLVICGKKFTPRDGGMALCFLNIPPGDLDGPISAHPEGHPAHHFMAYYELLKGGGMADDPIPTAASPTAGNPRPEPYSCDSGRMRFIDPYVCTLSSGCAPDDPDFPNC